MAGGGGSTGGIGAQSPAVNPPNPMGQIGDAVGGALGGMGGQQQTMPYQPAIGMPGGQGGQTTYQNPASQVGGPVQLGGNEFSTAPAVQPYSPSDARPTLLRPQMTMPYQPGDMGGGEYSPNPMGGLERPQVSYFGGSTLSNMGNNTRLGNNMSNMPGNYGLGNNMAAPPPQTYEGYLASRSPMQQNVQLTQDQWQQNQNRMQHIPQQQIQGGMGRQPTGQMAGLGALLGGMPNQPTPTAPPVSTTQPAPMAQPAPVAARPAPVAARPAPTRAAPAKPSIMGSRPAAKPMAKPSVVPPKTPPAVASAIQKLAAKKQNRR